MLFVARDCLLLACLAITGMLITMLMVPDGPAAIGAIAGTPEGKVSVESLRIALALDTVLPVGYGAGFVFMAIGLAKGERDRVLALAAVIFSLAGVTMDFLENGLTFVSYSGGEAQFVFATVPKFGLLALAGVLISGLLSREVPSSRLAIPIFRFMSPITLALLMSGFAGDMSVWFFAPGLLATFLFAAWVAHHEAVAP